MLGLERWKGGQVNGFIVLQFRQSTTTTPWAQGSGNASSTDFLDPLDEMKTA
jgi:hypothetical protein